MKDKAEKLVFIGADPGTANYGYAVIEAVNGKNLQTTILEIGMWNATITNLINREVKPPRSQRRKRDPKRKLASFVDQRREFAAEWQDLILSYNPRKISTERFQSRGNGGSTIERVTAMNMSVTAQADQYFIESEWITAASWKNQFNRLFDITDYYKFGLPPHAVDAALIAVYGAMMFHDRKTNEIDWNHLERQLREYQFTA